jgi:hypothetical protein
VPGDLLQRQQRITHQVGVGNRQVLAGIDHQAPQLGIHQREEDSDSLVRAFLQRVQGLHHGLQSSQPGVPDDLEMRIRELCAGGSGQPYRSFPGRVGKHMDFQDTVGHGRTVADWLQNLR